MSRPHVQRQAPVQRTSVTQSFVPIGLRQASPGGSSRPIDLLFLTIVTGLGLAIVCFGAASIPVAIVPSRAAADFMARRKVNMTFVGVALLVAAGSTFLLTGGR